jgi:hypothetical protein
MKYVDLIEFIENKMSMADVYQPVVIKELLLHGGLRSKGELASALAAYDYSVKEYYERIVMRWPKLTLSKHEIVEYERRESALLATRVTPTMLTDPSLPVHRTVHMAFNV